MPLTLNDIGQHKEEHVGAEAQIDLLAKFITENVPGHPRHSEGAGECAIRIINEYRSAAIRLWTLLDDIDTLDDMVKENDDAYRAGVRRLQRERFEVFSSDGYRLYKVVQGHPFPDPEPELDK